MAVSFANVAGTMFTHLQRHVCDKMHTTTALKMTVSQFARAHSTAKKTRFIFMTIVYDGCSTHVTNCLNIAAYIAIVM